MPGPPPTPTGLKVLRGNPGHQALPANEPKPLGIAPRCPQHLGKEARREWRRLVPILLRMRVLTEADYMALGSLCENYATMIQAQEKLRATGLLTKTKTGYVMQNPLLAVVNTCGDKITVLCREFGLTPAARVRLVANAEETDRGGGGVLNGQWRTG